VSAPTLEVLRHLDAAEVDAVSLLLEDVTEADGIRPLSEHATLHLRHGGDTDVRHLLVWSPRDHRLLAYAHLDVTDVVEGSSVELAVTPDARGQGLGRLLVSRAREESPDGRLRLWAHGEQSSARGLAEALGFTRTRTLWQMRRSLYAPLPTPELPPDVVVRTFEPGHDDEAFIALNAEAFADHPEQGGWSIEDLRQRIAEPWFDAAGFFLAERDGRLVGFHWTKVHGGLTVHQHPVTDADGTVVDPGHPHVHDDGHGHEPLGEVYVLGVAPAAHGTGIGKALTLIGLRHLRSAGLPAAMLYVEADNESAIALYTRLGFTHWDTDVMFRAG
jgi:mycothiol synthase